MIRNIRKMTLAGLLVALALGMPLAASAQGNMKAKTNSAAKPTTTSTKPLPFTGKLEAVDKVAKTITLSGKTKQTFSVTSETKIMKDGKPGTFDDAVVSEEIHGSYKKTDDGKMVAVSVTFGANSSSGKKKASDATNSPAKK